jgi:HECT-domain (ubiquitin-transferase)
LSLNDLNELSFQDFNEKINTKPSLEPFSETQDLAFPDFSSKSKVLNKLYLEILDLFQDIPKKEEYSSDTEDQMSINVYFDKTEKKNSDSNTPENLFTEETPDEIKDETLNFNHPEKKILEPIEEHLYNPIYIDEKLKQSLEEFSNPRNIFGSIEEEDSFIQKLLDCYYLLKPVNINTLVLLFLNLSKSDVLCSKILSGLLYILVSDEYFFIAFPGVFNHAKAVSALRAIETLHHMVSLSTKVCIQLSTFFEIQLSIIKKLHPQQKTGLSMLLGLFSHNLYKKSYLHLAALLKLISNLIGKLGVKMPALKQKHFNWICKLLRLENINDACIKEITDLILKLFKLSHCKETLIKALNQQIIEIGKEIEGCLTKPLVTTSGLKEIQLLRLCKILKSISGCIEEIDFLWYPLTVKLSNIQLKDSNFIHCTNSLLKTLLPLIESFFISHYDRPNSPSFQYFSENNHKVINMLIKKNPSLLSTTFNLLILRLPSLLDFENKRNYFRAEMREVQRDSGDDTIRLHVRRQEVFMDSYHQLKVKTGAEMYGKLRIQFVGEEGLDAGGLTREWYGLLARAMFNPNYALFIPSANGVSFQPNSMSSINTEHIQFFKFVGRIIGKALCDGYALDLYFTRSFYKHILSQQVNYQDMEDLDIDFYKSLKSLMNINLNESELHEYYFAYEEEEFGKHKIKELVPEGKTKRVTEENKIDYIKLLCHMKMTKNIQAQIDAFKTGFHELVPADLISIFDSKELELLISGLPNIDLEDLQANTDYYNYTKDSQVILWLWEVLYEFSHEERAEFLQFVTGSSKVPLEGFKALPGLGGLQKFQIHKSFTSHDRLPTAHTCMNQLDLPEYPSKEKLKNRLKLAISEGKEGFGFI